MIIVKHASKSFGNTRAVRDLSFALEPGQMTGLLGPNGAGKTTTIRMITGYLSPDIGTISIDGHPVRTDPAAARRSLGYLPESAPLYPELRPAQYLDYRAKLFGMPRRERRQATARVIDRCRLTDHAHKRIGVLSKGYRQRVGLAAALVHDPPVLILDEPTNGLDPAQMRSTRALIAELAADRTVLLCTHVIPEVERACARVLVLAGGRLVADGAPAEIGARACAIHAEIEGEADEPLLNAITAALGPATTLTHLPETGTSHGPASGPDSGPRWSRLAITPDPSPDAPGRADPQAALARVLASMNRPARHLSAAAVPLEECVVDLIEQSADPEHAATQAKTPLVPEHRQAGEGTA